MAAGGGVVICCHCGLHLGGSECSGRKNAKDTDFRTSIARELARHRCNLHGLQARIISQAGPHRRNGRARGSSLYAHQFVFRICLLHSIC